MLRPVLANAELNNVSMWSGRTQPLITWFNFLNFVTVVILSFFLLKIYRNIVSFCKWFRPVQFVLKCPNILVLGPKTEIIQEVVNHLSRTFHSEVIECSDVNCNSSCMLKPKTKLKKSQVILSHIPIDSKEVVIKFKAYIEKTFGVVDILIVSQNEEPLENKSTRCFLDHLNRQLLSQFWIVMTFLPGMLRRNRGHILSVALGKTSLINTGIMRSIHEELLQMDTKVKLTLVERNSIFENCYLPSLSADVLARLIVWSMWTCSSMVKVPSICSYVIMIPIEVVKYMIKPMFKLANLVSEEFLPSNGAVELKA